MNFSKILPGLALVLFAAAALAQTPIAVELEKMNVLYLGMENPIRVAADSVPDSCIVLRPQAGILKKVAEGRYAWQLQTDSTTVQLEIHDTCSRVLLSTRMYRVKMLRTVRAVLGSKQKGPMARGEFCAQGGIAVRMEGVDINAKCEVKGFDLAIYKQHYGAGLILHNTGGRFNASVSEKIHSVVPGDKVYFYHIEYQCPGMKEPFRYAEDLYFSIR